MKYMLYKATSPSGKTYIGVTNNFKRRLKEHGRSPYTFGKALRKYGKDNFTYEFELFPDAESAFSREAELVTLEVLDSRVLYNETVGGTLSNVLALRPPMRNPETIKKHPTLFSSTYNPMHNPEYKQKMIEAQRRKPVSIDGVRYEGVREAARQIGSYRQFVIHRLKSDNFPTWFYIND